MRFDSFMKSRTRLVRERNVKGYVHHPEAIGGVIGTSCNGYGLEGMGAVAEGFMGELGKGHGYPLLSESCILEIVKRSCRKHLKFGKSGTINPPSNYEYYHELTDCPEPDYLTAWRRSTSIYNVPPPTPL